LIFCFILFIYLFLPEKQQSRMICEIFRVLGATRARLAGHVTCQAYNWHISPSSATAAFQVKKNPILT